MSFTNIQTLCTPGETVNEDSCSVSERHLLVIDGASGLYGQHVTEEASDARWLALRGTEEYGRLLQERDDPMPRLCREACLTIQKEFLPLLPPDAGQDAYPSAGVAAVRLRSGWLEYYSLGDLTILLRFQDGHVERIHDQTLTDLDNGVIREMARLARERGEHVSEQRPRVQELLQRNRRLRNHPGGYWIFDPTAAGAERGLHGGLPAGELRTVALLSDGLADAVPIYKMEPDYDRFLARLEAEGPEAVCQALRELQRGDPDFDRYPRFKLADDATAVLARL
jgi:hypothetical protein